MGIKGDLTYTEAVRASFKIINVQIVVKSRSQRILAPGMGYVGSDYFTNHISIQHKPRSNHSHGSNTYLHIKAYHSHHPQSYRLIQTRGQSPAIQGDRTADIYSPAGRNLLFRGLIPPTLSIAGTLADNRRI